jgi:hypothetical protein
MNIDDDPPGNPEKSIGNSYSKICSCGVHFVTSIKNKKNCSKQCRQKFLKENALTYYRKLRNKNKTYAPCDVCGFSDVTSVYKEKDKVHVLCR